MPGHAGLRRTTKSPPHALSLGVVLIVAVSSCRERPIPHAVTATDTMARSLLRLTNEQLIAPNPARVQIARDCELIRLRRIVGVDSMLGLLAAVDREVRVTSTRHERERVLDSMAMKQFGLDGIGCDSVAEAGSLGGPWLWPVPTRLPGDSTWRGKY